MLILLVAYDINIHNIGQYSFWGKNKQTNTNVYIYIQVQKDTAIRRPGLQRFQKYIFIISTKALFLIKKQAANWL